ncbi:hypothetical protein QR680_014987 [Steinernema hermaphroditum]|uniref:CHK kinase-like domain-containing protein n=1 Tax=Steinernema hermaphroditum TaxID=289476 RepID=A0AA39IAP8_9BILA|nr:hypothetical protein QR680_014987 [Steinernema hermaphroditum]
MLSVVSPSLNFSQKLADSPFTIEWILSHLFEGDSRFITLTEGVKVKNVTAVDISDGKGFTSKVYKVAIEFDDTDEPYCVVLKVPGTESFEKASETSENALKEHGLAALHNKECDFFMKFSSHINAPLPKIYKVQHWIIGEQPGAILMESFFGKAISAPLVVESNIEQAFDAVRHLASIQAYFLCLPADQWQGKYHFTVYESFAQSQFFDIYLAKLKDMKPGMFDEGIAILLNNNNLLWKANPDGSISNELAAIIDWQTVHEGCLTNDLARFMALCVNADARRQHEDEILKTYYDTLVSLLEKEGKEVTFTLDQVKRAYRGGFVGQSLFTLICGPFLSALQEWDKEEFDAYLGRAKAVMEDALERLKELPEDKLLD